MGVCTVRRATPDDRSVLRALLQDYGAVTEGFESRLIHLIGQTDHFIAVAAIGSDLVGYAWAQDFGPHLRTGCGTARLHDLFVAGQYRRSGIGRQTFEAVREWSRERGVKWLQWQSSPSAVLFYEQLGLRGDPCPQPDHPFFEIEF